MKCGTRHIKYFLMSVALLCIAFMSVEVSSSTLDTSESPIPANFSVDRAVTASLSEKGDNMLNAVREMGKWGIPSTSVTLQGTVGRPLLPSNALQYILRACAVLCASSSSRSDNLTGLSNHTISTKRFHSGYYHCQMRC